MNAPQMLAHLVDWMEMARGGIHTTGRKSPLRYPPLKQLAIYWLPFPRGVSTAPELISRKPSAWVSERAAVCRHIGSFETGGSESDLAGSSGVRETDAECLGRVRLPPHGSPSQAIRSLTPILPQGSSTALARRRSYARFARIRMTPVGVTSCPVRDAFVAQMSTRRDQVQ